MLTNIYTKITIIEEENKEPCYFITICNCKQGPFPIFLSDVGFNLNYG